MSPEADENQAEDPREGLMEVTGFRDDNDFDAHVMACITRYYPTLFSGLSLTPAIPIPTVAADQ